MGIASIKKQKAALAAFIRDAPGYLNRDCTSIDIKLFNSSLAPALFSM
jgi:hypothetical protein